MVNEFEAVADRVAIHTGYEFKVNIVDGFAIFKPINQIQRRAANALDGGQVQLHRASGDLNRLGTQLKRAKVRMVRVLHPKRHAAGAGAVLGSKVTRHAFGFTVHNEIDVALAVQDHVFGAMFGHQRKAHALKHGLQQARRGGCKFNEFKAHQAHRVVKQICHVLCPC